MSALEELARTITDFRELPANWDSYDAPPINLDLINYGLFVLAYTFGRTRLLPIHISPMSNGSMQFEYPCWLEFEINFDKTFTLSLPDDTTYEDLDLDQLCEKIKTYKPAEA